MIIAAGLSMWVAYVATTVMLMPIVDSLFMELAISVKYRHLIYSKYFNKINQLRKAHDLLVRRGRKNTKYLPREKRFL